MKSINILIGEQGLIPKSLIIFPFPSLNLKGLIKTLEIPDESVRGGSIDSSITVLFNEKNDPIFYKYINNFEDIFNTIADKIIELEKINADKQEIEEEIKKFHINLIDLLKELYDAELSGAEKEAFPKGEEKEEKIFKYKVIVIGDGGVGKTSTVLRFVQNAFKNTYIPTIGTQISEKIIKIENRKIQFIIWDIAGQEKFKMMRKHFYQGADGQLLIFDLTRLNTFENIRKWYQDIKTHIKGDMYGFILGNKNDLIDLRKVKKEEGEKLANKLNFEYIETSALSGENVDDAFYKLGELLYTHKKQLED